MPPRDVAAASTGSPAAAAAAGKATGVPVPPRPVRRAGASASDWLQRAAGIDVTSARGRKQAIEQLRTQGERSAAALRSTVQDHPVTAALGALAIGAAVVWLMTRSSSER